MSNDAFNPEQALKTATNKKQAAIIADIVGHPKGAPSVEELDYKNPSLSEESICQILSTLREENIVKKLSSESGASPVTFYTLTVDARTVFDKHNLFPQSAWKRQYKRVEKPERIKNLQNLPRPTVDS